MRRIEGVVKRVERVLGWLVKKVVEVERAGVGVVAE